MEGISEGRSYMNKRQLLPSSNSISKPQNNIVIPIFDASQMASPSSSSENNSNKRSGIPPSHPKPYSSQIIAYSPNSQQASPSHSRSLSQPTLFSLNTMPPRSTPPFGDPSVSSLSDTVYNEVSVGKRVANSNVRSSFPSPRGHTRSSSGFPLGFSDMIQSSPHLVGNSGLEEPVQMVKQELTDELFNAYMNLDNLEALNSSGTEDKDLDSRVGTKTCGGESSDNEVESSVNGHPVGMHCNGMSSGLSIVKKEGVKRSAGGNIAPVVWHYRSVSMDSKFNEVELKKIMENEKLAEIAHMDPKRAKRILANRQSAARSKERKTRYIAELEHKVQTLQREATTLSAQLTMFQRNSFGLTNQNNELKFRLQAMEQQAQLKDELNEALAAEVQRLKLAEAELSGESNLSNFMARKLSIDHSSFRSQSRHQPNVHDQIQQQHQKQQQTRDQQLQNQKQMYNVKDSSVKVVYEALPRPKAIATLSGETLSKLHVGKNIQIQMDMFTRGGQVYMWGKIKSSVACGMNHSLVVVDRTNVGDRLDQLEVYDGNASGEGTKVPDTKTSVPKQNYKKGASKTPSSSKKRKKSKDASDTEEEENGDVESDSSDEDINGEVSGKGRGKGANQGEKVKDADKVGFLQTKVRSPLKGKQVTKRGRPRKS